MSSFAMASRGPKARYYPGANSLAIFSAQGSNPLKDCKVYGKGVAKVYDRSVKGYVYNITGGLQSKLQLPKDDRKIGLQLLQPFLVLQVFVPQDVQFSFELRVSDISNTRRKMYFSTSFNDIKSTPLHCQIPISMVIQNKWLTLSFDVLDLFNSCFRGGGGGGTGMNFRSIDMIVLAPVCKLRKIFTMRCRIIETEPKGYLEDSSEETSENSLPHEHTYALGVDNCIQILDTKSIQSAVVCNNEAHQNQDSRPGPEFGLSARKWGAKQQQQAGKALDNIKKAVHVAFGTRMPLPLSTVHINTNLPHDKCPTLLKDRIGKVYFISDPAAAAGGAATGGGGGEVKVKPPSNMVSRAFASLDPERRNLANSRDSKLMLKTNKMGCSAQCCTEEKEQVTNTTQKVTMDGGVGCRSDGDGEPPVGASEEGQTPKPADHGPESPKTGAQQQQSVSISAEDSVGVVDSNPTIISSTTNTASNKSPSKWVSRRKDAQMSTTHFKQQKCKQQRSKEYKHSRYMDSPPGSPPSGWDEISTGGRTLSGDINFHEHFLEGSWMNTQLIESIDAGKPYCLANSLKEKILSSKPHSLSTRLDEEAMILADAINYRDDSAKTVKDQLHRNSTECVNSFQGLTSSYCVNNEDTGTDHGHYWEDTESINACGDYNSEGQESWSSGSTPSEPSDLLDEFPCFLSRGTADAAAHKKLGRGAQSSKSDYLQNCLRPTSLLAKESDKKSQHGDGEDSLMFDIHDDRFFPGHLSGKRKDETVLDTHSMADSYFPSIQGKGVEESFDFDAEPNTHGEVELSFQEIAHEVKTSGDFRRTTMDTVETIMNSDTELASWHVPDTDEHLSCHISSGTAQHLADLEHKAPIKRNGRPDEDLDLLYDPTLDCYYDPKTNRYYELK